MNLIDETYFVAELNIPNTDKQYVLERVTSFIEVHEPDFLQAVLGYPLYKAFADEAGDYDSEASNGTIAERWLSLIEGADYTDCNGRLKRWEGLAYTKGETPKSPIANYVYFHLQRDNASQTGGVGEVVAGAENAVNTSPALKMGHAWNEMSRMVQHLIGFLEANEDTYSEWCREEGRLTLRKFQPINTFGI